MPQTISVSNEAFNNYLKIVSLPRDARFSAFGELSNDNKASFVKIQLALQLVKRPYLTKQQRDFILESITKVSADLYDKANPQKIARANELSQEMENKAFGLFAQKEAYEILEGLGANKTEDVALLQKYEDLLKFGISQRKVRVAQMPINERILIWKTQLAYHLAISSFNNEQKRFIAEIMPNIESIFQASLTLSGAERTKYLDALESSMFKVFSKAEAYAVFMTIGIHKYVQAKPVPSYNNATPEVSNTSSFEYNCDCRWYCDLSGTTCKNVPYCITVNNCGPLGTWECTNKCSSSSDN